MRLILPLGCLQNTPTARFMNACMANSTAYMKSKRPEWGWVPCDPLALALAVDNSLIVESQQYFCEVELHGTQTRGMSVVDWYGQQEQAPNVTLVEFVNLAGDRHPLPPSMCRGCRSAQLLNSGRGRCPAGVQSGVSCGSCSVCVQVHVHSDLGFLDLTGDGQQFWMRGGSAVHTAASCWQAWEDSCMHMAVTHGQGLRSSAGSDSTWLCPCKLLLSAQAAVEAQGALLSHMWTACVVTLILDSTLLCLLKCNHLLIACLLLLQCLLR